MKKAVKKKVGFTLDISPEVAGVLGVASQDELLLIIKGDEVTLRAKKDNFEHQKKQAEQNKQAIKKLAKDYYPVLKKLAKT